MIAGFVVILMASYLVILGAASFIAPERVSRFLLAFATSASAHYVEMLIRVLASFGLLVYAPRMLHPRAFQIVAWLLIISSIALLLMPWRWHRRFAQRVVPYFARHVWLIGLLSLALGTAIFLAVWYGDPIWR